MYHPARPVYKGHQSICMIEASLISSSFLKADYETFKT